MFRASLCPSHPHSTQTGRSKALSPFVSAANGHTIIAATYNYPSARGESLQKVLFDGVQFAPDQRSWSLRVTRYLTLTHSAQPRESRLGKTATHNDDLNLLEDDTAVASLITIIGICFESVHHDILEPFALFVIEVCLREYPEACARKDPNELRHIISQFTAPSRTGEGDQGVYVCHWCPLKPDERKTLKVLRENMNVNQMDEDVNHLDAFDKDEPVFARTFDRPQFSMDVLGEVFPDAERSRVVDLYTRRRPISDRHGNRLNGTRPYDFDPELSKHYAHCKVQVERSPGDWVTLAGVPAKEWFEACWGRLFKQGQNFEIGGRLRRVYFIDHMEYLRTWAKKERLESFRKVLRLMAKQSNIRISEAWIDKRIASLSALKVPEPPVLQCTPIQRDAVMRSSETLARRCSTHSEKIKAVWSDPAYRARLSAAHKANWTDPVYRAKTIAAHNASYTAERREKISADSLKRWADGTMVNQGAKAKATHARNREERERQGNTEPNPWHLAWAGDEERRAKVTAEVTERHKNPEFKANHSRKIAASWTDERKAEHSRKMAASWTAERRAKFTATIKERNARKREQQGLNEQ